MVKKSISSGIISQDRGLAVWGVPVVVWLRCRPADRRVAGSIPETTNFLTNSSGQATNAQSLANSLASFFYQKIVSLKDSIALKLHCGSTPFGFDQPHTGEVFSDFTPSPPAEVSQLLRSMSNKSSPLDYIPTSLMKSCADTFSILISHLANLSFTQATFPSSSNWRLSRPF